MVLNEAMNLSVKRPTSMTSLCGVSVHMMSEVMNSTYTYRVFQTHSHQRLALNGSIIRYVFD